MILSHVVDYDGKVVNINLDDLGLGNYLVTPCPIVN